MHRLNLPFEIDQTMSAVLYELKSKEAKLAFHTSGAATSLKAFYSVAPYGHTFDLFMSLHYT